MSILYLLIPLAAVLAIIGIVFFVWSVKAGQFEDLEGPGFRVLMDDDDDMIPDDARVKTKVPESETGSDDTKNQSQQS